MAFASLTQKKSKLHEGVLLDSNAVSKARITGSLHEQPPSFVLGALLVIRGLVCIVFHETHFSAEWAETWHRNSAKQDPKDPQGSRKPPKEHLKDSLQNTRK